jgi:hypothetical protein
VNITTTLRIRVEGKGTWNIKETETFIFLNSFRKAHHKANNPQQYRAKYFQTRCRNTKHAEAGLLK